MNRASVPPPASTRLRAGRWQALWLVALGLQACSLSQNGVEPPADTFFYPTAGIMSPLDTGGQWLYVANSNADLRFNDGTLVVANVGDDILDPTRKDGRIHGAAADRADASWGACAQEDYVNPLPRSDAPICCRDLLDTNIINCDERRYIASDATVLIGSFASGMAWQTYCDDGCLTYDQTSCTANPNGGRIFIGVRGDTSLTDVDVAPAGGPHNGSSHPGFRCTADQNVAPSLTECTQKVTETPNDLDAFENPNGAVPPQITLPDEPYALQVDDPHGYLYIGHLVGNTSVQTSGGVSLFDVSGAGAIGPTDFPPLPRFIAPFASPFPPNVSGFFGITSLERHERLAAPPGSGQEIFASSRYLPLVTSMISFGPSVCAGGDNDDVVLPSGDGLSSGLLGSEMRGVAFVDPTDTNDFARQVYALQRVPPALVGFDVAQNESYATTAIPTSVSETCSSPTFLYQYPPSQNGVTTATADNPLRLYVNCFDTGEVYIFDPIGPTLLTTLQVGRGPAGMVFDGAHAVAYVLNFTQNDVSVVDLAPGSPTQYHVVQRLGFPTVTPR